MKKIILIAGLIFFSLFRGAHAGPEEAANINFPIRGAYLPLVSAKKGERQLTDLRSHGITTVLAADGAFSLQEGRWLKWGDIAGKLGLDLWAVLHFAVPRELRETPNSYRPYVNRSGGVYHDTPCPLDESYWHHVIAKRFFRLAELSELNSLSGAAFDAEMYGSEMSLYYDLCYCDICWLEFTRSEPSLMLDERAREIPAGERFKYLSTHGLLREFTNFEWKRVRDILKDMRQQISARNAHFRCGFLGYRHTWFFSALIGGLGTQENPGTSLFD